MLRHMVYKKEPNQKYLVDTESSIMDIQDLNYMDFELMKKSIEKLSNKETFTKISLVEIIKKDYNSQSKDIVDHYVYLKQRPKPKDNCVKKCFRLHRRFVLTTCK